MDITFSKDAKVLEDDKCKNGTGVGGTEIGAVEAHSHEGGEQSTGEDKKGAAVSVKPFVGSGVVAVVMAVLLL
jgi:hypothetical protein